jgi:hypothetical protein
VISPPMDRIPYDIDITAWVLINPDEYFGFARHLSEARAHWQLTGKRKPMHRKGSIYWRDRRK